MFSMAGIPPLAGFFAKLYVFLAAIDAGLVPLAVIGVLASVVGAYYYIRIVKVMYFDEARERRSTGRSGASSSIVGRRHRGAQRGVLPASEPAPDPGPGGGRGAAARDRRMPAAGRLRPARRTTGSTAPTTRRGGWPRPARRPGSWCSPASRPAAAAAMAAPGPRRPATSTPRCCCARTAPLAAARSSRWSPAWRSPRRWSRLAPAGARAAAQMAERRADRRRQGRGHPARGHRRCRQGRAAWVDRRHRGQHRELPRGHPLPGDLPRARGLRRAHAAGRARSLSRSRSTAGSAAGARRASARCAAPGSRAASASATRSGCGSTASELHGRFLDLTDTRRAAGRAGRRPPPRDRRRRRLLPGSLSHGRVTLLLAIDVGNTNTVFALYREREPLGQWRDLDGARAHRRRVRRGADPADGAQGLRATRTSAPR